MILVLSRVVQEAGKSQNIYILLYILYNINSRFCTHIIKKKKDAHKKLFEETYEENHRTFFPMLVH
jgi:hypothetical protein